MSAYDPMMSSSPLKTATSVSGALSAYLTKYCEVATGGRVIFQGYHGFALNGNGWFRFKCQTCQDNWNMKTDLFTYTTSCPKELQDWLVQHKHVCDKFVPQGPPLGQRCVGCGWAWEQHKAGQPTYDIETGMWSAPASPTFKPLPVASGGQVGAFMYQGPTSGQIIPYQGRTTGVRPCVVCDEIIAVASGSSVCDECYKAAKSVRETKKLTTTTQGRLFRNMKEDACESQKPTNQPNSLDSANLMISVSKD